MRQTGPRLHRLPQRLDYTLIPAPLDLSLPIVTEKSPLPAIIVTPSSPSSAHDFSIAFLAPPKEPGFFEKLGALLQWGKAVSSSESNSSPLGIRTQTARTLLIIFLILFVMVTHAVTHRMAQTSRRPHLDFSVQDAPVPAAYALGEGIDELETSPAFRHGHKFRHGNTHGGWFDLSRHWGDARFEEANEDDKNDFVVLA
eukprot:GHVO01036601.1.p1 GENE.GHVO01036601.1~~GHVO01036601.1.p1  ORF type:complete len:199 (-),score=17.26 GHVO01036601.1:48-644(-)